MSGSTEVHIRQLEARDRPFIEKIVTSSGNFNDVEIATALELVDEALSRGEEETGYLFAVLECGEENHVVQGYACYGPVPLTQGNFRHRHRDNCQTGHILSTGRVEDKEGASSETENIFLWRKM